MDYAALFAAGVAGMAIGLGIAAAAQRISNRLSETLINSQRDLIASQRSLLAEQDEVCGRYHSAIHTLNALRANCFLTNERGHRVRYADASVEVRARAEGGQA